MPGASIPLPDAAVWAVVPAAGSGARVGTAVPKQYLQLAGRPLLAHTLRALAATPKLAGLVIVVARGDERWRECVPQGVVAWSAEGGAERMQSVHNGLQTLESRGAQPHDWALVHDAARPCLAPAEIHALLDAVHDHEVGGLLARPVTDTLKRAQHGRAPCVAGTVAREGLWHALTPQVFRFELLRRCIDRAAGEGRLATDESQAMEWAGYAPLLIAGSGANIKVTVEADLVLAEHWLRAREVRS